MKLLDRLFASLMFFTRLPWWRLREVPSEAFKHIVDFWPQVGWVTGGTMALTFLLFAQVLPFTVALLLSIASRLLLTGALHEDGWADFCDGMGGGSTRERTLAIMKDSHIGTYGVLGLILYFALYLVSLLEVSMPIMMTAATMLFADVYAKSIASFIIILPYARDEEGAKAHVVYQSRSNEDTLKHILRIIVALLLPVVLMLLSEAPFRLTALLAPIVVFICLMLWMKRKIGGYTGDCCGACFLLCELTFWLFHLMHFQI